MKSAGQLGPLVEFWVLQWCNSLFKTGSMKVETSMKNIQANRKNNSPKPLYSGRHLGATTPCGVSSSKYIVAINNTMHHSFEAAQYGIVGDAMKVLPKLVDAVKTLKK